MGGDQEAAPPFSALPLTRQEPRKIGLNSQRESHRFFAAHGVLAKDAIVNISVSSLESSRAVPRGESGTAR